MALRRNTRFWITAVVLLLVCCVCLAPALAQGENSDSPGEPGKKPLHFDSITLRDSGAKVEGATTIPLQPEFKLVFDKNVVNLLVWENNRQCFTLSTAEGRVVPINVSKIDDTVSFTDRHNVFIKPTEPLQPGTAYILTVSPELRAKNNYSILGGTTGGQGIVITFQTEGVAAEQAVPTEEVKGTTPGTSSVDPVASSKTGTQTVGKNTPEDEVVVGAEPDQEAAEELSKRAAAVTDEQKNSAPARKPLSRNTLLGIITAVVVLGWVLFEFWYKRRFFKK